MNNDNIDCVISKLYALRIDIAYLVEGNKPLSCNDEDELCEKIRDCIKMLEEVK